MCVTETLTHDALDVDDLDALYPAGEIVPESAPHDLVCVQAVSVLRQHFSTRSDVFVAAGVNVYYTEGTRSAVVAPDVMVVAGVPKAQLAKSNSYRTFQHGGSLRFALEVASPKTIKIDKRDKRTAYAAIGVAEYWRVDPTGGDIVNEVLNAERLTDGRWAPIDVTVNETGTWRGHSQALDLDIAWCDRELLFYLPGSDQPLRDLPRAETALSAEQQALRTAETAHHDERQARRAAERKVAAQAGEIARQDTEIARLKEQLRRQGSSGAGRPQDPPG